jgi:hypothetical protein
MATVKLVNFIRLEGQATRPVATVYFVYLPRTGPVGGSLPRRPYPSAGWFLSRAAKLLRSFWSLGGMMARQ